MNRLPNLLRALAFSFAFHLWIALLAVLCLPLLLSRRLTLCVIDLTMAVVMWLLYSVVGIECHFRPKQPLPRGRGRILAPKHQSAWETMALRYYYPRSVTLAKRSLFRIPFFGWYLWRAGYISINRRGGARMLKKMMDQVNKRLDQGFDVVIYPEGTRRPVGAEPHYKSGIYGLYRYCGVEVMPIALDSGKTWGTRFLHLRAGQVQVMELPVLPQGLGKQEFMQELESRIEQGCKALEESSALARKHDEAF